MTLSKGILDFLNNNANRPSDLPLNKDDNLFNEGALHSFLLIELVNKLEEEYDIKISDEDVDEANFQTISTIESYLESRMV